jgi:hypothetical protein
MSDIFGNNPVQNAQPMGNSIPQSDGFGEFQSNTQPNMSMPQ